MVTKEELASMSGDKIWECFDSAKSGEEAARVIETAFNEQWRDMKKEKIKLFSNSGNLEVRVPNKNLDQHCVIGIDPITYELMIGTSQGWRKSGQVIKTVL